MSVATWHDTYTMPCFSTKKRHAFGLSDGSGFSLYTGTLFKMPRTREQSIGKLVWVDQADDVAAALLWVSQGKLP